MYLWLIWMVFFNSCQKENQSLELNWLLLFHFFVCGNCNNWNKNFSNSNIKGNLLDFLDKLELFTNSCFLQIFHWHFPENLSTYWSRNHPNHTKLFLKNFWLIQGWYETKIVLVEVCFLSSFIGRKSELRMLWVN